MHWRARWEGTLCAAAASIPAYMCDLSSANMRMNNVVEGAGHSTGMQSAQLRALRCWHWRYLSRRRPVPADNTGATLNVGAGRNHGPEDEGGCRAQYLCDGVAGPEWKQT
jgi:hypothetical protein